MNYAEYLKRLDALMTPQRVRDYEPGYTVGAGATADVEDLRAALSVACGELTAASEAFDTDEEARYLSRYAHTAHYDLAHYLSDLARWIYEVRSLLRAVEARGGGARCGRPRPVLPLLRDARPGRTGGRGVGLRALQRVLQPEIGC